jgi:CRP-like cAMP-binding protein
MPYRLKNGIFLVRCRYPGCPFNTQVTIEQKIMGMTEKDVEQESKNLAKDIGRTKHDAMFGMKHALRNPDVRKVSGFYELVGGSMLAAESKNRESVVQDFDEGEIILQRGEQATTICEVVRGSAYPEHNPAHRYGPGDCFGASALLANHNRTCDVIAGKNGTRIAFHNLIGLSRRDPKKATKLFQSVMEDTLAVIQDLEQSIVRARREVEKETVRG